MMMLLLSIISALVAGTMGLPGDLQPNIDAKALCENKEVDLHTSTQLHLIARQIGQAGVLGACPEHVSKMIIDLSKFLRETQENVCSKEAALGFKSYYLSYIDKSGDKSKDVSKKVPKRFKKFVLALGMQMSNKCKRNMLDVLTQEDNKLLNQEDVARLGPWVQEKGPLGQMLASMDKPGEIILPADLAALMSRNDSLRIDKMFIQSKATKTIKNFQETCRKRFQPIYEPLILPITLLSGIGFDYRDQELKAEFKKKETKKIIRDWTSVVFICESLKFVEPVEYLDPVQAGIQDLTNDAPSEEVDRSESANDLSSQDATSDMQLDPNNYKKVDDNQLRLLTKDEAEAINQQIRSNPKLGHLIAQESLYKLEEVEFKAKRDVPLGDLILDKSDGKLIKSISSFRDHKTQMERIKGRMISRALVTLRRLLKKRKVVVLATSAAKVAWRRLTTKKDKLSSDDVNRMLVSTVEQMADRTMDAQKKWTTNEVVSFVVVLICALAALSLSAWAIGMFVVALISAISAVFGR